MALDAVSAGIKPDEVRAFLNLQPGVTAIHDLHIWPVSTTETALTCHCLITGGHPGATSPIRLPCVQFFVTSSPSRGADHGFPHSAATSGGCFVGEDSPGGLPPVSRQ
jgi:hypothetical protein